MDKGHLPLSQELFLRRLSRNACIGLVVIVFSLFLGMAGYRYFEGMNWVEAYENAAMILSGMGPVKDLSTDGGKLFAGTYALFSGIIFLVTIAIIFAPLVHLFFRHFHLQEK